MIPEARHSAASEETALRDLEQHDPEQIVQVSIPRAFGYVRLLRLAAGGMAASCGLDVEEIEDVRIAVDELASLLVEGGKGPEVRIAMTVVSDRLVLTGTCAAVSAPELTPLARQILGAVVSYYEVGLDHGQAWFRFEVTIPRR